MKASNLQNLIRGLLATVGASKTVESRIRLQKIAYFLHLAGVTDFLPTRFGYHRYGPYSRELSDVLHEAIAAGLLREIHEEADRYSYHLTDQGRGWLDANRFDDSRIRELVPKLLGRDSRALELAATVAYLRREEDIPEEKHAFHRALELKPDSAEYADDAKAILAEMDVSAPR